MNLKELLKAFGGCFPVGDSLEADVDHVRTRILPTKGYNTLLLPPAD